ncbi:Uncharacterized protein SCF082_LOCUS14851, partial [Durusdinium trenchii]
GHGTHTRLGLPSCSWVVAFDAPCPTCGMTTAVTHAANGDLIGSFLVQPAGAIFSLVAAVALWCGLHGAITGAETVRQSTKIFRGRTWWLIGGILLAAWAYKMAVFESSQVGGRMTGSCSARSIAVVSLLLACVTASGCNIVGFFGAIEAERRRSGTITVERVYDGLEAERVAVIVDVSREIDMVSPQIAPAILGEIIARLQANAGVESIVPARDIQRVLYDEPGLLDRTFDEIAARFDYVWSGQAAGNLLVIEADSYLEDDVRLEQYVNVTFPDQPNTTIDDLSAEDVASQLLWRFANRSSWFFYDHKERYPEYQEY